MAGRGPLIRPCGLWREALGPVGMNPGLAYG